jgi:hypothetical protein
MRRIRVFILSVTTLACIDISAIAYAQSYPPPPGYSYGPPPCQAVTHGGFGALRGAVRRGSARSAGVCY